jgi:hypothetical protein
VKEVPAVASSQAIQGSSEPNDLFDPRAGPKPAWSANAEPCAEINPGGIGSMKVCKSVFLCLALCFSFAAVSVPSQAQEHPARDHMPIDAQITASNRFRRAREAGNAARHDLDREEDNGFATGLKHRAMDHVEKAIRVVDHILHRFDSM